MAFYGKPEEGAVLTKAELFAYGPRSVRVEKPETDWDDAKEEWAQLREERSEERVRKAKEVQWYYNPRDISLQDREARKAPGNGAPSSK